MLLLAAVCRVCHELNLMSKSVMGRQCSAGSGVPPLRAFGMETQLGFGMGYVFYVSNSLVK